MFVLILTRVSIAFLFSCIIPFNFVRVFFFRYVLQRFLLHFYLVPVLHYQKHNAHQYIPLRMPVNSFTIKIYYRSTNIRINCHRGLFPLTIRISALRQIQYRLLAPVGFIPIIRILLDFPVKVIKPFKLRAGTPPRLHIGTQNQTYSIDKKQ